MIDHKPLLGGVELGGTKCVCIVGTGPGDIRAQTSIPTGCDPEVTLRRIDKILNDWQQAHGVIEALGIASFGPINLARRSPTYGFITSTTKPGWSRTDIVGRLNRGPDTSIGFDTDVNGAALAEKRWGAALGLEHFAYLTVGTGVGVGLVVGGRTVFGCNHGELGHVRVVRAPGDTWPGICKFHGDCVEGLASGPAIAARAGMPAADIPTDSPVWDLAAHALAQLLHTIVLATAPQRILIGGGVTEGHPALLAKIRRELTHSINGYLDLEEMAGAIDRYVVVPGLGPLAGPLGSLALAADAHAAAVSTQASASIPG
ncbi:MAG: ROK family protein [Pseudomonadota bacterium]|nr:ROK family protein [Pseudomonadota bacterium]